MRLRASSNGWTSPSFCTSFLLNKPPISTLQYATQHQRVCALQTSPGTPGAMGQLAPARLLNAGCLNPVRELARS